MLKKNMPSYDDTEGPQVPAGYPGVIDAHVHLFPHRIASAVWQWFDDNGWPIRYQMTSSEVLEYLLSRGVRHVIALQYAHKPGIAADLNRYMTLKCDEYKGHVTGMATVFPGEKNAENILQDAFDAGLGGLKLHAHVQCFDMNSQQMSSLYEICRRNKKPVVMHIGREPSSTAYRCDPYELCSAEKLEKVINDFPGVKFCVPHLGFNETAEYRRLIEKYDNLWLDTAMVITDYFKHNEKIDLGRYRGDRIMYGSDFPNIPYAWDRELRQLEKMSLSEDGLEKFLSGNAAHFFGLNVSIF